VRPARHHQQSYFEITPDNSQEVDNRVALKMCVLGCSWGGEWGGLYKGELMTLPRSLHELVLHIERGLAAEVRVRGARTDVVVKISAYFFVVTTLSGVGGPPPRPA